MNQNQDNLYNELVSKYEFNILQKEQIKLGLENLKLKYWKVIKINGKNRL